MYETGVDRRMKTYGGAMAGSRADAGLKSQGFGAYKGDDRQPRCSPASLPCAVLMTNASRTHIKKNHGLSNQNRVLICLC